MERGGDGRGERAEGKRERNREEVGEGEMGGQRERERGGMYLQMAQVRDVCSTAHISINPYTSANSEKDTVNERGP